MSPRFRANRDWESCPALWYTDSCTAGRAWGEGDSSPVAAGRGCRADRNGVQARYWEVTTPCKEGGGTDLSGTQGFALLPTTLHLLVRVLRLFDEPRDHLNGNQETQLH